jgi:hypothetical protein
MCKPFLWHKVVTRFISFFQNTNKDHGYIKGTFECCSVHLNNVQICPLQKCSNLPHMQTQNIILCYNKGGIITKDMPIPQDKGHLHIYHISRPTRHTFFPENCDLNSTCVLCAKGEYYFQTYEYLYIYYTTSLSYDFGGSNNDFLNFYDE